MVANMPEKRSQIKDSQVKKNLRWRILRLLRLDSRTRQKLLNKLSNMCLGYWHVNDELVDLDLNRLADEGLITYSDVCEITRKGPDAMSKKERDIEEYYERRLSKEACARYSLFGNVGLSSLEFVVCFPSGSIGLIADAIHTAVDIVASGVTWIGITVDKETGAALIGGIIPCGIGLFIAFESP